MTLGCNLWDTIAIVIAFDSLYKDFDSTITSLLETEDKTIDQIQSILHSKEVKNLSKRATKNIGDLLIAFRDRDRGIFSKRKANSNGKCYNCYKLRYFRQDSFLLNRRLNKSI